jgi:hypothetical protein
LIMINHRLVGPLYVSRYHGVAADDIPEICNLNSRALAVNTSLFPNSSNPINLISARGSANVIATHLSTHFPLTKLMTQGRTLTSNLATRKSESATEARTNNV